MDLAGYFLVDFPVDGNTPKKPKKMISAVVKNNETHLFSPYQSLLNPS